MRPLEARIDVEEIDETAHQEAGADDERDGEGHLPDDQRAAHRPPGSTGRSRAVAERGGKPRPRRQQGCQPEDQPSHDREQQREEEHVPVERHLAGARNRVGAERDESFDREEREPRPHDRGQRREHETSVKQTA